MKTKIEDRKSKVETRWARVMSLPLFVFRFSSFAFAGGWRWLRQVSGDDAYERYLRRATGGPRLSPSEFYRQGLERKYARPCRCC
jgi:hypothetical protein